MARKQKPIGWKKIIQECPGTAVIVEDYSPLRLTWYELDEESFPDRSGQDRLTFRKGFILDDRGWALAFGDRPGRRDAVPTDYDLFWTFLAYVGASKRKHGLQIDGTDLCEMELKGDADDWDPRILAPSFRASRSKNGMKIELDPQTTATFIYRCAGRAMFRFAQRIKDSPTEPYLRVLEILSTLDYNNFGLATAHCAVNYERALERILPQPFWGDCFYELGAAHDLDHPRRRMIDDQDTLLLAQLLTGPVSPARIIYLQEIQCDIRQQKKRGSTYGESIPTIRRRIRQFGIPIRAIEGVGSSISVEDYLRHRAAFHQRPTP